MPPRLKLNQQRPQDVEADLSIIARKFPLLAKANPKFYADGEDGQREIQAAAAALCLAMNRHVSYQPGLYVRLNNLMSDCIEVVGHKAEDNEGN